MEVRQAQDWARRTRSAVRRPLAAQLAARASAIPRWGYWKCCTRLRIAGACIAVRHEQCDDVSVLLRPVICC